jgi:predicted nucleic acid-binding protein
MVEITAVEIVGALGFLIDTNVLFAAKRGDEKAVRWLQEVAPERCYVSVITLGAIMREQPEIDTWLEQLCHGYGNRILPVDEAVAMAWGKLAARRERPDEDGLIAATAMVHRLAVVSRNVEVFFDVGVTIINPFV